MSLGPLGYILEDTTAVSRSTGHKDFGADFLLFGAAQNYFTTTQQKG
jgi:hypothetical protein